MRDDILIRMSTSAMSDVSVPKPECPSPFLSTQMTSQNRGCENCLPCEPLQNDIRIW